jgi:hypothetical protein
MINVFGFLKRKGMLFLSVMLALCLCLPQIGMADTPLARIDVNRSCSLSLVYQNNGTPIEGASFQLYFVADVSDDAELTMFEAFEDSGVDLTYKDESEWSKDASTLSSFITLEGTKGVTITAVAQDVTNSEGKIVFNNLETGVYLITGDAHKVGDVEYDPVEALVMLPEIDSTSTDYSPVVYPKEVTIFGKDDDEKNPDTPDTPSTPSSPSTSTDSDSYYLNVVKIWDDTGFESVRPSSVTVVLMQDGKQYDKVVLSKDNNWRYRWENLDENSKWELAEDGVPANYTATSVLDGNSFIVTNTRTKTKTSSSGGGGTRRTPGSKTTTEATTEATTATAVIINPNPSPQPDDSEEPTEITTNEFDEDIPDLDDNPDEISEENEDDEIVSTPDDTPSGTPVSTPKKNGTLPQTGQLWWPIPLALMCGIILLMLGTKLRNEKRDEQEK